MRIINRREFIKLTGATALCACAGAAGLSGCATSGGASNIPLAPQGSYRRDGSLLIVSLTAAAPLNPVGGAVRVTLDDNESAEIRVVIVHAEAYGWLKGDYGLAAETTHDLTTLRWTDASGAPRDGTVVRLAVRHP